MKASLEWLNAYLDAPVTGEELERRLPAQGFPVEERLAHGGDLVYEIEVTSNRPDCLSHVGLARELAAGTGRGLLPPEPDAGEAAGAGVEARLAVAREAEAGCPYYTACVLDGASVGPSPAWLVRRLEAVGLRSVNNVVDVTNYVLLETGQPLHAFDLAKLAGPRLVIRSARSGERIEALDGSRHSFAGGELVIADAERPVAIAGVMGGAETAVSAETTAIALESAIFDPVAVRQSSRGLKLTTDSSHRFERGVDPAGVAHASHRALALIRATAGGAPAPGWLEAGSAPTASTRVAMRTQRCNRVLGLELSVETQTGLLHRLALEPEPEEAGRRIACAVPSFRRDLAREVDLIEEIGRLHGLDAVPSETAMRITARPPQPDVEARRALGRVLTAHGYHETVTFGFLAEATARRFLGAGEELAWVAAATRSPEAPVLRPSLIPSLLACRKHNQDLGNRALRLFEVAETWRRTAPDGKLAERQALGLLCDAPAGGQAAVRDLRGTLEELFAWVAGPDRLAVVPAEAPPLEPAARLEMDGEPIGVLGWVPDDLRGAFDLEEGAVAAELAAPPLWRAYPPAPRRDPLPRVPGIDRELSVLVDEGVAWASVEAAVRAAEPERLESIRFLETYRGKPVPRGKKSVSFRLRFRDPARTLTHEEVAPQADAVVAALRERVGAELRG